MLLRLIKSLFGKRLSRREISRRPWRYRPDFELLEGRLVLAFLWTGKVNSSWFNPENWYDTEIRNIATRAPGRIDDVEFDQAFLKRQPGRPVSTTVMDIPNHSVRSLDISSGYEGQLKLTQSLTIIGMSLFAGKDFGDKLKYMIDGPGNLTLQGDVLWASGIIGGTGSLTVKGNAHLQLLNSRRAGEDPATSVLLEERPLLIENRGMVTLSGNRALELKNTRITNYGTFVMGDTSRIKEGVGNTLAFFANRGTFRKETQQDSVDLFVDVVFDNASGSVVVPNGKLVFRAGGVITGSYDSTSDQANGGIVFSGPGNSVLLKEYNWTTKATFRTNGQQVTRIFIDNAKAIVAPGGNQNTVIAVPWVVLTNKGEISGPGTLRITQGLQWDGGAMSGSGQTILDGTGFFGPGPHGGDPVDIKKTSPELLLDGRAFLGRGQINFRATNADKTVNLVLGNGAVFSQSGRFELSSNVGIKGATSTPGTFQLLAGGSLNKVAGNDRTLIDLIKFETSSANSPSVAPRTTGPDAKLEFRDCTITIKAGGNFKPGPGLLLEGNGNKIIDLQKGKIEGDGQVRGPVLNGGIISPGGDGGFGSIFITAGYYEQLSGEDGGVLSIGIGNPANEEAFDFLDVNGIALLGGELRISVPNGLDEVSLNQRFSVVRYTSFAGTFASVTGLNFNLSGPYRFDIDYTPTSVDLVVVSNASIVAPAVTGLSLSSGTTLGWTEWDELVEIGGTGFAGVTSVMFGNIPALEFTVRSSTEIVAKAPPGPVGVVHVRVTNITGTSEITTGDEDEYTYVAAPLPAVSSVGPNSGYTIGGTEVIIIGENFTGAIGVSFGSVPAAFFRVISDTAILAVAPPQAEGTVDVTVSTYSGTSQIVSADQFAYAAALAPSVTMISLDLGSTAGGTAFTISGTSFVDVINVSIGGSPVANYFVNSDTLITVVTSPHLAGTYDVTVTTSYGASLVSAAARFTYEVAPAPTVTGLSTNSGSTSGSAVVVISGSGFTGAFEVLFGNVSATDWTFIADDTLIATTPPGVAGVVDVRVSTYSGTSVISASDQFTYQAAPSPVVSGVSLASGSTAGGSIVTLMGSNFLGAKDVYFGSVPALDFEVVSDSLIVAIAPPQVAATVDVRVESYSGISAIVSADEFVYVAAPAPAVSRLSVSSGQATGGTLVVLTGSNFTGATGVNFGGTEAEFFYVEADDTLVALAPAHAAGTVHIIVSTFGGTSTSGTADEFTYEAVAAPAVSNLNISSASTGGGTAVIITGTGFADTFEISFGGTRVRDFEINSDTQITAIAPPHTAGTWDVVVSTLAGVSPLTSAARFTYVAAPAPAVTALDTTNGSSAGGTQVLLTGSDFGGATEVRFGDTSAVFELLSDSLILVTAPPNAVGTVHITVTTLTGTSAGTTADEFTYFTGPTPELSVIGPASGSTAGGAAVVIQGSNFTGTVEVLFGTVSAEFTIVSDTLIFAQAPSQAAGAVDVRVRTFADTSAVVSGGVFTYQAAPAPEVTGLTPSSGSTTGGGVVTITGSSFTSATAVTFGGKPALSFWINSDTSITAVAPLHAAGTVDVQVATYGGTSTVVAASEYTYNHVTGPAPTVTTIGPATGTTAGGTAVAIRGTRFASATAVSFDSTPAASFTVLADDLIVAISPAGAAGAVQVTVTTPDGTSATGSASEFTYLATAVPEVTDVDPPFGSTGGNYSVTITGNGFTDATDVLFGDFPAVNFTVDSDTQITAVVPPQAAGFVSVLVIAPAGISAQGTGSTFLFTAAPAPELTGLDISTGTTAGGTVVTITGTDFDGATAVFFGDTPASSVTALDNYTIVAVAPARAAGTVDVRVRTWSGTSTVVAAGRFTYEAAPAPDVTGVSPSTGSTGGNYSVTITGSNFTAATAVYFGDVPAASYTVDSDTQITAIAPAHVGGTVDVRVLTYSGSSVTSAADQFAYTAATTPAVTGVSPGSGSTSGGATVTITGSDFTGASQVAFGSVAAVFEVISDTEIRATVPAQAAGIVDVIVTTPSGTSAPGTQFEYQAAPAPAVSALTPASGGTAGGTLLTIIGSDFTGATEVWFGDVVIESFEIVSDSVILATAPTHAAGTVDVRVTTPSGTSDVVAAGEFQYQAPGVPTLTSISATSGSTAGGTLLTLAGTNLREATGVSFGGTTATFVALSDTEIVVVTPAHDAGTWDIIITTLGGRSALTADSQFTYTATAPPEVSAVSPSSGSTAGGAVVQLTGSNFTGATAVFFGEVSARFTFLSDTSILAFAPSQGTGTVPVTVLTASGTSVTGAAQFTYDAAAAPEVTALGPDTGTTAGGTVVTITGSHFTGATGVTFGDVAAAFRVLSDTTIVATAPLQAAGVVDVTVTTASGTSATTTVDLFTYTAATAPAVVALTSSSGGTAGGASVTIIGSGFTGATEVLFGDVPATSFRWLSDNAIVAIAPAQEAGAVAVRVTTFAGTSDVVPAGEYTYTAGSAPDVTGLTPASGGTAGGTIVIITGSGLANATEVLFGDLPAVTFWANSDGQLTAVAPAGAAGTVDILVTSPAGTSSVTAASEFTYQAAPAPAVTGIAPSSGSTAGATVVVITGTDFSGVSAVSFGDQAALWFVLRSDTEILAVAPPGAVGVIDVRVTTPSGTSPAGTADEFTYVAGPAPAVTGVTLSSGTTAGTTLVSITGSNFTGVTEVRFGSVAAASAEVVTDTLIVVTAPAQAAGIVDVVVITHGGQSAVVPEGVFEYVAAPAPAVTLLTPASGSIAGGTVVTLIGSGFTGATAVSFGNEAASTFTIISDSAIVATAPAHPAEVVNVTVTTYSGTSTPSIADEFTFEGPPVVDAGSDAFIDEGGVFTGLGSFTDVGGQSWSATVDYGDGSGEQELTLNPDQSFNLEHTYAEPGVYTVTVTITDDDGEVGNDTLTVETLLRVTSFTATSTGFVAVFNQLIDTGVLSLYDTETAGLGAADATLAGTGANVRGSLVTRAVDGVTELTFIRTNALLAADDYTATLRSAANAFRTSTGGLLDGDADGTPGGDYVTTFTVSGSSAVVVSIPDFTRGAGQPVDVPATSTGLPLRLSDGDGVTDVTLTLLYDPDLLELTAADVGSGVPAGATVYLEILTPGVATLTFSSPTALSAGAIDFVVLTAEVPDTAPYAAKHVLDLTDITINGGTLSAVDNDGLHVAAYFGDTTGNAGYSSADANLASRVALGLDSGFAAYRSADPVVIADITGNGTVNSTDATRILQEATGIDRPEIPPLPGIIPPSSPGGPDPFLNFGTGYVAEQGETVTVTLQLDLSNGLSTADLAISYDTSRLQLLSADDVQLGSLTADFDLFVVNLDAVAGVLRIGLGRTEGPISGRGSGSVVQITFHVRADAPAGGAIINLRQDYGTTTTQLNEGGLDLIPDPSNEAGDLLDGLVTIPE